MPEVGQNPTTSAGLGKVALKIMKPAQTSCGSGNCALIHANLNGGSDIDKALWSRLPTIIEAALR